MTYFELSYQIIKHEIMGSNRLGHTCGNTRRGRLTTEQAAPESKITVGVDDECDRIKVELYTVSTATVEL